MTRRTLTAAALAGAGLTLAGTAPAALANVTVARADCTIAQGEAAGWTGTHVLPYVVLVDGAEVHRETLTFTNGPLPAVPLNLTGPDTHTVTVTVGRYTSGPITVTCPAPAPTPPTPEVIPPPQVEPLPRVVPPPHGPRVRPPAPRVPPLKATKRTITVRTYPCIPGVRGAYRLDRVVVTWTRAGEVVRVKRSGLIRKATAAICKPLVAG
jgi:hypothetical protein